MKHTAAAGLGALLCTVIPTAYSDVEFWEVAKAQIFEQTADNIQPASASGFLLYAYVETEFPGDAASISLEGGHIVGSYPFDQNGSEWELAVQYPFKAAMDDELPGDAVYFLILTGAGGSVTQQFMFGEDNYAQTPYLTGADWSSVSALDLYEPLELNWNDPGEGTDVVFQLNEGSLFEGDEVLNESPSENRMLAYSWPNAVLGEHTNYTGLVEFINRTNYFGNGFGADGEISFNRLTQFVIAPENKTWMDDDFANADTNGTWQQLFSDSGQALTETNGRLEWTSAPGPDHSIIWKWLPDCLSVTQDWSIALDLTCLVEPSAMTNRELWFGLGLLLNDEIENNLTVEFLCNEYGREVKTSGVTNDTGFLEVDDAHDLETIAVKMSYDSGAGMLYSSYSLGGDYIVQTHTEVDVYASVTSDNFCPVIFFGGYDAAVGPGQVYVDNFRVYGGTEISNDVDGVELEFLHSYGDGVIFTEGNWIRVDATTSHAIKRVHVTTSGGENFDVPFDGSEGSAAEWDAEVEFPFAQPWNPANDGIWTVTFERYNGIVTSTQYPFLKEDGNPIPNFYHSPLYLPPTPANHSRVNTNEFSFAWAPAGPEANHVSFEEIIGADETGSFSFLYADAIPGADLDFIDAVIDGPLSITNAGPFVLGDGFRRVRINEGYARAAYNDDGIPYIVVKINEADVVFTVTADVDADQMDDSWEIQYFGATNAVNGGPLENFDGDALNNLEEFIAGVNPADAASVFAFTDAQADPGGFTIQWPAVEGRIYDIFWTDSLMNPPQFVTSVQWPFAQYTDTESDQRDGGFYILKVRLAE